MIILPFTPEMCTQECGHECGAKLPACPVYRDLPLELQEACQANLHLLQYLHVLPLDELGIPQYYEEINRGLKGVKNRNLIYPVNEQVFVHILANPEDVRDHYIPIEPSIFDEMVEKMDKVEVRLADFVEELEGINDAEKRLEIVLDILDRIVDVRKDGLVKTAPKENTEETEDEAAPAKGKMNARSLLSRFKKSGSGNGAGKTSIEVSLLEYQSLRYLLKRKLIGMGPLQPMIWDNFIEDISCSGLGKIFVEHKVFGGLTTAIGFQEHEDLDKFVIQLSESIKHPVTFRNPIVDATLPDGSRINIGYGIDVSKNGSNFTIRKFTPVPVSIIELIQFGSMNFEMAAYLSLIIQEGMNVFVSGETASGKTTLMNAVCTFVPPDAKIVSIEDTPEVQVPHPNWIRGVTRGSASAEDSSAVGMFDLLKAALRQRPNLIIIGEIRGEEGAIAFQAMQTGHAVISTFHAATVTKLIQRVSGDPINVPKAYVDNLNVVVIAQAVRLPNGQFGRRTTSINEIVGYDSSDDAFSFMAVFNWNPINDTFDFKGNNNSFLLEEKIAPARGIPYDKRRQIYSQIKQRAEVLKKLYEQKITDFYELYAMLGKAYREGYFR